MWAVNVEYKHMVLDQQAEMTTPAVETLSSPVRELCHDVYSLSRILRDVYWPYPTHRNDETDQVKVFFQREAELSFEEQQSGLDQFALDIERAKNGSFDRDTLTREVLVHVDKSQPIRPVEVVVRHTRMAAQSNDSTTTEEWYGLAPIDTGVNPDTSWQVTYEKHTMLSNARGEAKPLITEFPRSVPFSKDTELRKKLRSLRNSLLDYLYDHLRLRTNETLAGSLEPLPNTVKQQIALWASKGKITNGTDLSSYRLLEQVKSRMY